MEVLVFSTSVNSQEEVMFLKPAIDSLAGSGRWNFALDDCERILRIVNHHVKPIHAIELLRSLGFECRELE
ncbi:MAG TPA: hypothetical protein VFE57_07515 [Cyclobacteriaceae bacterium]|jgi:hypothetical protein|nr:hypothetical protein [Cyclobacteriaceae bacterium]